MEADPYKVGKRLGCWRILKLLVSIFDFKSDFFVQQFRQKLSHELFITYLSLNQGRGFMITLLNIPQSYSQSHCNEMKTIFDYTERAAFLDQDLKNLNESRIYFFTFKGQNYSK